MLLLPRCLPLTSSRSSGPSAVLPRIGLERKLGADPAPIGQQRSAGRSAAPRQGRAKRRDLAARASSYQPFSWNQDDYYKVSLQIVASQPRVPGMPDSQGNLVLIRGEEQDRPTTDTRVLMLSISGDVTMSITRLLNHGSAHNERPLALDLLWSILQRGREISGRDWALKHVAITDLREFVFLGRLFFGDSQTGEHVWDCDSRPSDACWLALRGTVPIYVHKGVWDNHAVRLRDLTGAYAAKSVPEAPPAQESVASLLTTLRAEDPEPLKLLKRKMAVAITEEDYVQAAAIRDHPYMALHLESQRLRMAGRPDAAEKTRQQMLAMIEHEASRVTKDTRKHTNAQNANTQNA